MITPKAAVALQEELRHRVIRRASSRPIRTVAGVDISVRNDEARAAIVVLKFPAMEPVDRSTAVRPVEFPYVPGLLGFREVPSILDAFAKLRTRPDLLVVDGHGLAHPRRFGVACHVGVELDLPSIGCGKSRLVGEHREPGARRGSRAALRHKGEVIGSVLRTRDGVKPVYVSIGHRMDLPTAVRTVLRSCSRYRLPEPIRHAHHTAGLI